MRVPVSWLKKYVPVTVPLRELAQRMTMAGVEVGGIEEIGADWDREKIVVGKVLRVDPHPNADRLSLPTVDLGHGETATVVCGAPNVSAGQKIAFAKEGARLFSPRTGKVETLKAARIRGVLSAGMVCSALELGLSQEHEGILVLDPDAPVGMPLADYLGDAILEIEPTPNRIDCASVLGIAHEVAALTGQRVTEPDLSYSEEGPAIESLARIEIADPELCHRYTASLVTGIKVGPSPRWLQEALTRAGQRPINNVVDITNYVMLEYNQPLHAFDFHKVKERTVIVRAARPGEALVTLDGQARKLAPPMLVIADAHDAIGLAGIMGGANTEIDESTTAVLLESANFSALNTRRTASALQLKTEASYRFERSIRAELAPLALRRATQLLVQVAGGKAARGIIDLYPGRKEEPVVRISRGRVKQVLGVDFSMQKVEQVLTSLGFQRAREPEGLIDLIEAVEGAATPERETLWLKPPYWRSDISIEDDLVEEVARILGYDTMPTTMLSTPIPYHAAQPLRELRERLKDLLVAAGMQETISYSLTDLESLARAEALRDGAGPLKIANPMSSQQAYLRTSLRGSILETLASNRARLAGDAIRIFEAGRVYLPREEAKERDLPHEKEVLVGVLSGPRAPDSWLGPRGDMDFFDAKGVLEFVFGKLGVEASYGPAGDAILHPGKTAQVRCGDVAVGVVGEVHPRVLERYDLQGRPVAFFELDLEVLSRATQGIRRRYRSISRFPESERDLAVVVDADIPSARPKAIIDQHRLVARSALFDVYTGPGIPEGKKSLAYRIVFQSHEGTLTAEQVNEARDEILRRLQREVGAELRG